MNFQPINRLAATLATALILLASAPITLSQSAGQKLLTETASQPWTQLMAASKTYRESLERIVELQKQEEARAAELLEKRKTLLALGAISKRELEEGEQALRLAQAKLSETRKQIEEVDYLLAEVSAAEQLTRMPSKSQGTYRTPSAPSIYTTGALFRYIGSSQWALSDFGKVDAFFRAQFGKSLAVSAYGQSATHNRLGFDHRAAVDVAVHPDSHEGRTLIEYLRNQGIPFIAIRCPIPGSATGAHIHIGLPSKRIVPL